MANEKRGSPETGSGARRRRPPTTIDLKATEVASEPVQRTEPIDPPQETARAEAPQAAPMPPDPPRAPPSGSQKPAKGWRPEWLELAVLNDRISALRADLAERLNGRLLGAGAIGATGAVCLFVVLWAFGAFTPRDDLTVTLAARLAILELQVRDLASKPLPPGLDQRALADLAARVGAAEQAMGRLADVDGRLARSEQRAEQGAARIGDLDARLAKAEQGVGRVGDLDARVARAESAAAAPRAAQVDSALVARVAALEAALRPLAELAPRLDATNSAARDAKARADAAFEAAQKNSAVPGAQAADHKEIEALGGRIAALEQGAKSAEERIARAAASAGADRAVRFAFVAQALRVAVERGEPFTRELAAAKPFAPDGALLGALEPFAAAGVPRAAALAREFAQLVPAMLGAANPGQAQGGIIDRLQANAERLVRIRPINEAPGDEPAAAIARAELKAAQGDLAATLAELARLPEAARAPAQAWIKKAETQAAALSAARRLAESAVGALTGP